MTRDCSPRRMGKTLLANAKVTEAHATKSHQATKPVKKNNAAAVADFEFKMACSLIDGDYNNAFFCSNVIL